MLPSSLVWTAWTVPVIHEEILTRSGRGCHAATPFNADDEDEATQNFVKKYQEQYGETPIQFAATPMDLRVRL